MFAAALALMDEACAAVFDETQCLLMPRRRASPNAASEADPARGEFLFWGTLEFAPSRAALDRASRDTAMTLGRHVNAEAVLTALTSDWPYAAKERDAVRICDDLYTITEIHRDSPNASNGGRIAFYLSKAS